ncbi:unnamed protein product [Peniophora sp. CBMAI 1063]|nr:unnamed protein product [Peniophora sp. CBMAI 1063]
MVLLPADLIYHIFIAAAEVDPPAAANVQLGRAGTLGWISLTHVTRSWREVGLHSPRLWAGILLDLPTAYETILRRARQGPLTFDFDKVSGIKLRGKMFRRPDLLRRAHTINDSGISDLRTWSGVFDFPQNLPHLQFLRVRQPALTQPMKNKEIEAPYLRHCELDLRYFPFTSAPRLTTLRLYDTGELLAHPSWQPLLAILLLCPALEDLHVDAAVRPRNPRTHGNFKAVHSLPEPNAVARLPHLSHMKVEMRCSSHSPYDPWEFARTFLRRIEIPTTASVSLGFKAADGDDPYEDFVSALSPQLVLPRRDVLAIAISQSNGVYTRTLHRNDRQKMYDVISTSVCSDLEAPSVASTTGHGVTIKMDREIASTNMPRLLKSLARAVAPVIRTLVLRDGEDHSALSTLDSWREDEYQNLVAGLSQFSEITTLYLNTWTSDAFVLLTEGGGKGLLPELSTVVVDHTLAMKDGTAVVWWEKLAAYGCRLVRGPTSRARRARRQLSAREGLTVSPPFTPVAYTAASVPSWHSYGPSTASSGRGDTRKSRRKYFRDFPNISHALTAGCRLLSTLLVLSLTVLVPPHIFVV